MAETIISREAAKAAGLKRYYTGIPCKNGHLSPRYTAGKGQCVTCQNNARNKKHAEFRAANPLPRPMTPEEAKAAFKAAQKKYRDKKRAEYLAAHPEIARKMLERAEMSPAEKLERRKEREKEKVRLWHERNPGKAREYAGNRRARKLLAGGMFFTEDIERIHNHQKGRCAICRKKVGDNYHVDHIVPLYWGGSNWPANLQILCPPCNIRKHDRDPIEHMRSLGFLL